MFSLADPDRLTARLLADLPDMSPARARALVKHLRADLRRGTAPGWRQIAATIAERAEFHRRQAQQLAAMHALIRDALAEADRRAVGLPTRGGLRVVRPDGHGRT